MSRLAGIESMCLAGKQARENRPNSRQGRVNVYAPANLIGCACLVNGVLNVNAGKVASAGRRGICAGDPEHSAVAGGGCNVIVRVIVTCPVWPPPPPGRTSMIEPDAVVSFRLFPPTLSALRFTVVVQVSACAGAVALCKYTLPLLAALARIMYDVDGAPPTPM